MEKEAGSDTEERATCHAMLWSPVEVGQIILDAVESCHIFIFYFFAYPIECSPIQICLRPCALKLSYSVRAIRAVSLQKKPLMGKYMNLYSQKRFSLWYMLCV